VVVGGQSNNTSGVCSFIGGGRSNTASGSHSTIAGGKNLTASGAFSFAAGCAATASGCSSVAMGAGTASGYRSVVIGSGGGAGASNATGNYSATVGGSANSSSGSYSFSTGYGNVACASHSAAFGCGITASAGCTVYSNNFCACSCMFAAAFFETSDCRLKNIHNTHSAYDGINFANFSWKSDAENKSCYGYIAQDVEKILPNAVHNNIEGYKQVDYNQVNTYKLSKLEERIAKLEDKLKKYEA
jgi:hypothetical protein